MWSLSEERATLRGRVAAAAAGTVGLVLVLIACICYVVVRHELRDQIDNALRAQAQAIQQGDFRSLNQQVTGIPASAGGPAPYVQLIGDGGKAFVVQGGLRLPVRTPSRSEDPVLSDARLSSNNLRLLAFTPRFMVDVNGVPTRVTIELARPLDGVDRILSDLRLVLLLLIVGGVVVVATLSRISARRVLRPITEVAAVAEHITETGDLTTQIPVNTRDEVGRLAERFNTMISRLNLTHRALDNAVEAQRQLIADASHELRTPVTSLRTNLEVLELVDLTSDSDRHELLTDMREQTEELSALITDLIELARGDSTAMQVDDVRLDELVESSVMRARRDFPGRVFELVMTPVLVEGVTERLRRAIDNLLRNAALHSGDNEPIEVLVNAAGFQVRDHGRGVAPEDLPHLFERFYRSAHARSEPGTGLGLAIVKQVADQHAAEVTAVNATTGGAIFSFHFHQATPIAAAKH